MAQTHRTRSARRHEQGTSYIELLTVVTLAGIILAIGGNNLHRLSNPLDDQVLALSGLMLNARADAIATTGAVRVDVTATTVTVARARNCAAAASDWTSVPGLTMTFERGVRPVFGMVGGTPQTFIRTCFDARGQANANTVVTLQRADRTRALEVMLAGGVRSGL